MSAKSFFPQTKKLQWWDLVLLGGFACLPLLAPYCYLVIAKTKEPKQSTLTKLPTSCRVTFQEGQEEAGTRNGLPFISGHGHNSKAMHTLSHHYSEVTLTIQQSAILLAAQGSTGATDHSCFLPSYSLFHFQAENKEEVIASQGGTVMDRMKARVKTFAVKSDNMTLISDLHGAETTLTGCPSMPT